MIKDDDYYNVNEVNSACQSLEKKFGGQAKTMLPAHTTRGAKKPLALRVGAQSNRPVFMVIGGVHGDEWGSCEIILNLASDLLHGQLTGLDYGGQCQFSAADIKTLLQNLSLVLVPLVNPDGRLHSQVNGEYWRKNRSPGRSVGVDLNRNFDFAFDIADSNGPVVSGDATPASPFFRGPNAFSEAESKNVEALVNAEGPNWFVDLHSGARCVAYPRSVGPQFFPAVPTAQLLEHLGLAQAYADAVASTGAPSVPITPGYDFIAASGTSHDWVYERGQQPGATPALAFMIEWSQDPVPMWSTMKGLIPEVTAGLVAMCLAV